MKIDKISVDKMVESGYVSKTKHPDYPIYILNYTKSAQFNKVWNNITMMCRGLIIDEEYNILYRGFQKFFNYEEIEDKSEIPNLPFEIYDKLDGSLGILYWYDNKAAIATRGSFSSDQAIHATKLLNIKYKNALSKLDKTKSYLFEIIYPENHIIINYKDIDDIFLLAIIDPNTGLDCDNIQNYSSIFNVVHKYDGIKDYNEIRNIIDGTNKEGFVVKFSNSYRIKMKFADYFRLHAIRYGLSEKRILEYLTDNNTTELHNLINSLDEENKILVTDIIRKLNDRFNEIEQAAKDLYKDFSNDKEAAEYFKQFKFSPILFNMRKNRKYDYIIWRMIKDEMKQSNKDV
jgi:RNA ligase